MAEMKVYLPDDLDLRFRKIAMTIYGYGRGSISKAATEALRVCVRSMNRPNLSPGKYSKPRSPQKQQLTMDHLVPNFRTSRAQPGQPLQ